MGFGREVRDARSRRRGATASSARARRRSIPRALPQWRWAGHGFPPEDHATLQSRALLGNVESSGGSVHLVGSVGILIGRLALSGAFLFILLMPAWWLSGRIQEARTSPFFRF